MFRATAVTALVGAAVLAPCPAGATFLPGEAPVAAWHCAASVGSSMVTGDCGAPQHVSRASRVELIGLAVVTSLAAEAGYSGTTEAGGEATASAGTIRITTAGLNVQAFGVRTTQSGGCAEGAHRYEGSVHIDRLLVNGREWTDVRGPQVITTAVGTVTVGEVIADDYDNSFDTHASRDRSALTVRVAGTTVRAATAAVGVTGFCG